MATDGRSARRRSPPFVAPPGYEQRRPEQTPLYQIVQQHYPAFLAAREAAGRPLPRCVRDEFEAYLKCGRLEHGFLRPERRLASRSGTHLPSTEPPPYARPTPRGWYFSDEDREMDRQPPDCRFSEALGARGVDGAFLAGTVLQVPWSIALDGSKLAYYEMNPATGFDLWTAAISVNDEGLSLDAAEPFLRTPSFEVYPSFSPDGQWLAYASNESGTYEVYVRRFPDDGTKVRVSDGGGRAPRWSPNGREILFQTDGQRLMAAPYRFEGGSLVTDAPLPWTPRTLGDTGVLPGFDIAPDGERVVALMAAVPPDDRQTPNHVILLLNFHDEVERRLGAGER